MEIISGNIFIRPNKKEVGEKVIGHKHNFDHTTIFFTGKWKAKATLPNGTVLEKEFMAPSHALIRADVVHEFECLEAGEFWCVYSHRTPQGDIIQEYNGWGPSYGHSS